MALTWARLLTRGTPLPGSSCRQESSSTPAHTSVVLYQLHGWDDGGRVRGTQRLGRHELPRSGALLAVLIERTDDPSRGSAPALSSQRPGHFARSNPSMPLANQASSAQMSWLICPRSGSSISWLIKLTCPLVVIRNGSPTFFGWTMRDSPKRVRRHVSGSYVPGPEVVGWQGGADKVVRGSRNQDIKGAHLPRPCFKEGESLSLGHGWRC